MFSFAILRRRQFTGGDDKTAETPICEDDSSPGGDAKTAETPICGDDSSPGGDAKIAETPICRDDSSPGGDAKTAETTLRINRTSGRDFFIEILVFLVFFLLLEDVFSSQIRPSTCTNRKNTLQNPFKQQQR